MKFDTIHLHFPTSAVEILDPNVGVHYTRKTGHGKVLSFGTTFSRFRTGINVLDVQESRGRVKLCISSKTLGTRYGDKISNDSLPYLFDRINAVGVLSLDLEQILVHSEVSRVHVTHDIMTEGMEVSSVLEDLHCLKTNGDFICERFNPGAGLAFRSFGERIKTQDRLIVYDKFLELQHRDNSQFRAEVGTKTVATFKDVVRVERNLESISSINNALGTTGRPSLRDVLESKAKPLHLKFKQIVDGTPSNMFSALDPNKSIKETITELGLENLVHTAGGLAQAKRLITKKASSRATASRWISRTKALAESEVLSNQGIDFILSSLNHANT